MAFFQSEQNDQRSAAGLSLNSNNPFRNRDRASPTSSGPQVSPFDDPPPRPTSRNPFLDIGAANSTRPTAPTKRSVSDTMSGFDKRSSATAEDLFASITLDDRPSGSKPPPPPVARRPVPPPVAKSRGPPPAHRPSRSQEEDVRSRKPRGNGGSGTLIDIDSPPQQRRTERRPRRNSDTSVLDLTEDEKEQRARDARRRERERERRHRENKEKKPTNRKLDIIDQLDATSIYGTGMFHHDGPFDALNPHRNKNGSRRAPMEAFPEGSLNNSLGGAGPLNPRPDHATFMGQHDDEAYRDWTTRDKGLPSKNELPVFDPTSRGSAMHGDESLGLGTSTFLEGTPAARTAIQQRQDELAQELTTNGLARKKSLAHRIRNINKSTSREREFQSLGRLNSADYGYTRSPPGEGGRTSNSMNTPNSERNPFFSEYSQGKGGEEGFSVRKTDNNSPRGNMERRATTDAAMTLEEGQPKPTGILGRMKSLKGGRRTRPAPPGPDAGPVPSQFA
ncbi:Pal1 cell morphology domain-containing protein [Neurospora intermedia]|uniref:Pal1 cell morphology domain-containing protein n=1 Tax=Neurospora intermedia TaxID=5142 RepID=A0ABR3DTN8_NEUIN